MSHELKGLYGVAYSCSNNNNKYCDDWFIEKYQSIYKHGGIRSLNSVKDLGFNHIRTYYLKPDENHNDFLQLCVNLGLTIEIGISNNLLDNRDVESIKKLVNSTRNYKCVKMYTVGNEYFGNVDNVTFALELIYSLDNTKYLMHSCIFDNGFQAIKKVYSKLSNNSGIKTKYIVSLNVYFYNNSANSHGDVIQNVIKDYYNDDMLKYTFLIISEFGNNKNEEQWNSLWNFSFGNVECLKKYNKYLGYCLFSYTSEGWKGNNLGENNYGILTENGEQKSGYHALDQFKNTEEFKRNIRK
jgi:hypothetical protein